MIQNALIQDAFLFFVLNSFCYDSITRLEENLSFNVQTLVVNNKKKQGRNDPASCSGAEVTLPNMGRESLYLSFFCKVRLFLYKY